MRSHSPRRSTAQAADCAVDRRLYILRRRLPAHPGAVGSAAWDTRRRVSWSSSASAGRVFVVKRRRCGLFGRQSLLLSSPWQHVDGGPRRGGYLPGSDVRSAVTGYPHGRCRQ